MRTYRVICTKNEKNTIVDFATANDAGDSIITHASLFKLRQHETPDSVNLLPPLFLQEKENEITIFFDKPEKASSADFEKLEELRSHILASYAKMKHQGKENTLELTSQNHTVLYESIVPYKMNVTTPEAEKIRKELIEKYRKKHTQEMKNALYTKPQIPSWKRHIGD